MIKAANRELEDVVSVISFSIFFKKTYEVAFATSRAFILVPFN